MVTSKLFGSDAMLAFRNLIEQAFETVFRPDQLIVQMLVLILLGHQLLSQQVVLVAQALAEPNELGNFLLQAFQLGIHADTISLKSL